MQLELEVYLNEQTYYVEGYMNKEWPADNLYPGDEPELEYIEVYDCEDRNVTKKLPHDDIEYICGQLHELYNNM